MAHYRPAHVSAPPATTPSNLLAELEAIIVARNRLLEEQERLLESGSSTRLQWARALALELVKGVNLQAVIMRCKDLDAKEQRYKQLRDSLVRSLHELDCAIQHYEQTHRQDLLQALQVRLEQVDETRKEHHELQEWRDALLRKPQARGVAHEKSLRRRKIRKAG